MLVQDFRTNHKADLQKLPMADIILTEKAHINGLKRGDKPVSIPKTPVVIVRRQDNKYALVTGYRDYVTALNNHDMEILGIIVPNKSQNAFFKALANLPEIVKISDLKVPKGWTLPRAEKVQVCIDFYKAFGTYGKKIFVDENYKILDGYAAVVAAQQIGNETVYAIVVKRSEWQKNHSKKKLKKS